MARMRPTFLLAALAFLAATHWFVEPASPPRDTIVVRVDGLE